MLQLRGQKLTLEQIAAVANGREQVALADDARSRMEQSRRVVEKIVSENRTVYGVNTGFGKLSDVRIEPGELRASQLNLVRSHSCGLGNPLSLAEARAMLLLRANVLACGLSGARPVAAETLVAMLERGVTPVIPEKGSVGASGDLAPLAHLALCAIGEGEAFYQGARLPSADALKQAGIAPLQLEVKEGLALLNGTQAMGAVGGLALQRADRLARLADVAGAMSLEALKGTPVAFDERIHAARPHAGQIAVAAHLRALLAGSEIRQFRTLTVCAACRRFTARCATRFNTRAQLWKRKPEVRLTTRWFLPRPRKSCPVETFMARRWVLPSTMRLSR